MTDFASDMFYLHTVVMNDTQSATAASFVMRANQYQHIDSKAMRKVNDDQDVILTIEAGSSGGFVVQTIGRFLIKES